MLFALRYPASPGTRLDRVHVERPRCNSSDVAWPVPGPISTTAGAFGPSPHRSTSTPHRPAGYPGLPVAYPSGSRSNVSANCLARPAERAPLDT